MRDLFDSQKLDSSEDCYVHNLFEPSSSSNYYSCPIPGAIEHKGRPQRIETSNDQSREKRSIVCCLNFLRYLTKLACSDKLKDVGKAAWKKACPRSLSPRWETDKSTPNS
jgi:hypothetical protein